MAGITPMLGLVMAVSVGSQLVGAALIPATRGFTAPLATAGCLFGFGFGIFLLARLITQGAPLSLLLPLTATLMQITAVMVGVFIYGEAASIPRIACLLVAAGLVGLAGLL